MFLKGAEFIEQRAAEARDKWSTRSESWRHHHIWALLYRGRRKQCLTTGTKRERVRGRSSVSEWRSPTKTSLWAEEAESWVRPFILTRRRTLMSQKHRWPTFTRLFLTSAQHKSSTTQTVFCRDWVDSQRASSLTVQAKANKTSHYRSSGWFETSWKIKPNVVESFLSGAVTENVNISYSEAQEDQHDDKTCHCPLKTVIYQLHQVLWTFLCVFLDWPISAFTQQGVNGLWLSQLAFQLVVILHKALHRACSLILHPHNNIWE